MKKRKSQNLLAKTISPLRQSKPPTARRNKQSYLEEATVEDKQVTFISLHSENDEDSDIARRKFNPALMKKRLANKIDHLFMMLYRDLNLLIDWESEQHQKVKMKNQNLFKYSGIVWVHRGVLAERLQRTKLAEKAYRCAIDSGYSVFAWYRLLKIYADTYNPKACLV